MTLKLKKTKTMSLDIKQKPNGKKITNLEIAT